MCSKRAFGLVLWVGMTLGFSAQAKVFLTVTEALEQCFPKAQKCSVTTQTRYLTEAQVKRISQAAGNPLSSSLVVQYTAQCDGKLRGHAYTDTHRVRTHPETLFVAVGPDGKLIRTEVLSFEEPLEYIPKPQWYESFTKKELNDDLQIKKAIPFVTGASLTGRATLEANRRVLAIDSELSKIPVASLIP